MLTKNYKIIWISIVLLLIYLFVFFSGALSFLDKVAYDSLISFQSTFTTSLMVSITFFGSWIAVVVICIIAMIIRFKKGLFISLNIALVYALNNLIKIIVMRPRPTVVHLVYETGYSFPSGHAMVSFALYILLAYFLWDSYKWLSILFMICPFLIGMTRVYLGVHYITDIIAGYLFAFVYLSVLITSLKENKKFSHLIQ